MVGTDLRSRPRTGLDFGGPSYGMKSGSRRGKRNGSRVVAMTTAAVDLVLGEESSAGLNKRSPSAHPWQSNCAALAYDFNKFMPQTLTGNISRAGSLRARINDAYQRRDSITMSSEDEAPCIIETKMALNRLLPSATRSHIRLHPTQCAHENSHRIFCSQAPMEPQDDWPAKSEA